MINPERYEVIVTAVSALKETLQHLKEQRGLQKHEADCLRYSEIIERNLKFLDLENKEAVLIKDEKEYEKIQLSFKHQPDCRGEG